MNYLKMPWSIEDTIENLEFLKKAFQSKVIDINQDGIGEQDADEVAFDFDRAINALKENQEYHQFGTLEEVRDAVERQKAKSPTYEGDGYAPDGTFVWDEWLCPHCGSRFEVDYDDYNYCPDCGQKIDWGEEE